MRDEDGKGRGRHTPGPWKAEGYYVWAEGREYCVALCQKDNGEGVYRPRTEAECSANAAIIAAAPKMLAALETVSGGIVPGQDAVIVFAIIEKVRAAIAKARG